MKIILYLNKLSSLESLFLNMKEYFTLKVYNDNFVASTKSYIDNTTNRMLILLY